MRQWLEQFLPLHWFEQHQVVLWWLAAVSALMFVATLLAVPWIISRIPADYFLHDRTPAQQWFDRHPALRLTALIVKNAAGAVLVLAGIAMLVLPGQGILTIVIGLSLLNFPGKRRLELWIIRRSAVMRAINWMRRQTGHPPLLPPDGVDE